LLDNKDRRFTPGLFARVELMGRSRYKATLIDDRAVGTDQSQKFVYVVAANNTVSYRAVKLGRNMEGLRVVREGLQPGELIVVNGLQRVMPGATVAPHRATGSDQRRYPPDYDHVEFRPLCAIRPSRRVETRQGTARTVGQARDLHQYWRGCWWFNGR
jgi:hypothetical protein